MGLAQLLVDAPLGLSRRVTSDLAIVGHAGVRPIAGSECSRYPTGGVPKLALGNRAVTFAGCTCKFTQPSWGIALRLPTLPRESGRAMQPEQRSDVAPVEAGLTAGCEHEMFPIVTRTDSLERPLDESQAGRSAFWATR